MFSLMAFLALSLSSVPTASANAVAGDAPAELLSPPLPFGSLQSLPVPVPTDAPFGPNVRVSEDDTPGNQNEITMAVASDGRIHMGWNDARQPQPDYRCGYSYSTDGGVTWAVNQMLHVAGWDASGDPVVVVDSDDTVYFVCMPFSRSGGGSRIVVYKSTDRGATFATPVVASDTTNGFNDKPWAHTVGTTIHICYANFAASVELRYTRSTDGGQTWDPTRILDNGGNGCVFASTASGRLYLAWVRGGGIYALASPDGGTTWTSPRPVGGAPFSPAGDQRAGPLPAIAADWTGGNVYLVWTANDVMGAWDVRFSRSVDGGFTWSGWIAVNDDMTNRQFMPAIDVDDGGTIHVSYYDNRTGQMAYRYTRSTDGGLSWAPSTRVTDLEWPSAFFIGDYTALVADAFGYVNCGWADVRSGEVEAYFARAPTSVPPVLARIDVSPPEAWTDADTSVLFTAAGYDQFGQPYPLTPAWAAKDGTISNGLFTPSRTGDWTVWANESGISGAALVHVSPGALAGIDVRPADVTITADDTQQYSATGYDQKGNVVGIAPSWGASDGSISAGLLTPRAVGLWTVYANASGFVGSTSVTVIPGALATIVVSPPLATINSDEVFRFTATGYDAKGNVVPVSPAWGVGGGTIDGTGLYAPAPAGTWTVYANASGIGGTAQVTVVPGALARIAISPQNPTITADNTQQFSATGFDAKGNSVPVDPVWTASVGVIDAFGLYTPTPVGTFLIHATSGSISDSTTLTVLPGRLARIEVIPPEATITADNFLQLMARGYDGKENDVAVLPSWAATCGSVSGGGLYTPSPARLCIAYANASDVSGSSAITVVPGRLARIDVSPPLATITADDTLAFTAMGYDGKENAVAFVPTWSVPEGGIDASGLYAPRFVGTWEVRAEASGIRGTAAVTVTPGALAAIDVDPAVALITADEFVQFIASGRDAKGNAVPVLEAVWSAENGSASGGRFEPYRVGAWRVAAAQGGVEGWAQVTVSPGAVHRVIVEPGTVRLMEGALVAFTAAAYDAKGNAVPYAVISWRVTGGIGDVDSVGGFRAIRTGAGQVVATASDGLASASAAATIRVDSDALVSALPWFPPLILVPILLLLLWRRRRKPEEPDEAPSPP